MEKQLDFCSTLSGESVLADEHSTHTYVHMSSQTHWHTHAQGLLTSKTKQNTKNLGRAKQDWVVTDACGHMVTFKA